MILNWQKPFVLYGLYKEYFSVVRVSPCTARHLKLEFLTQYPVPNYEIILLLVKCRHLPDLIIWSTVHLQKNNLPILLALKLTTMVCVQPEVVYTILSS